MNQDAAFPPPDCHRSETTGTANKQPPSSEDSRMRDQETAGL